MQKVKLCFAFLAFTIPASLFAQTKFTVSGTIRDKKTGESLIGASVILLEKPRSGVVTNSYGFFSITAETGKYKLSVSFTGYTNETIPIELNKNINMPVSLTTDSSSLQEVVVTAHKADNNVTQPLMGVQKLSIDEIKNIPVLFGEKDILKTIQLLPGIKSAGEGNTGFYVRGGNSDQNLILLDEALVYNASHLLGFFSTFNSDAIKDVTVYKGDMPANYGGRLSSVVDIKMKEGNDKYYSVSGGIGLIDSRLNVEGPIVKDKGSFIVSARRTYADLFLKLSKDTSISQNTLYFYDINAKANYTFNEKNRVYCSFYFGRDNLGLGNLFGTDWGNSTATARWNHLFNSRLFSNTSVIFSKYNFRINVNAGNNEIGFTSNIKDFDVKEDLQYYISNDSKLDFGLNIIHHNTAPGIIDASATSSFNSKAIPNEYALENVGYISHEWAPIEKWKFIYGARFTAFSLLGPGNFYTYDKNGNPVDTATYSSGKIVKTYMNLEPRFSMSYQLTKASSLKFSYARNVQNMHLITNSTSGNPTDLWLPSSNNIKPEIADQIAAGYYRNFDHNRYEFSTEIYYKLLQNQIDYKNGAQLNANENVESQLIFGKGHAYGIELYLKKKYGKLTGWVSYTLSKVENKFVEINNDSYFPAKQDETHNISIVGMYQASKKWTLSATWVYNTGSAVTFPSGKYDVNGDVVFYYTERNGYRMPAYHRLDLGATVVVKKTEKKESSWTFSLYNAYGRANAYSIIFQQDPDNPAKTQAVKYSLFKWVPSITYNFKF